MNNIKLIYYFKITDENCSLEEKISEKFKNKIENLNEDHLEEVKQLKREIKYCNEKIKEKELEK